MRSKNNYIILYSCILIILLVPCICLQNEVLANSPSFPIQQIGDEIEDLNLGSPNYTITAIYPNIDIATDPSNCTNTELFPIYSGNTSFSDIASVSYYSDGKHLNATIWLNSFNEDIDYDIINRDYFIQIDVKSVYDAYSADFTSGMNWNNKSQFWTKEVAEFAGSNLHDWRDWRYIEQTPLSFDLIQKGENGRNYIPLSFDLESINSPDEYRVLFATEDIFIKDGIYCDLIDITDYFPIPPPQYNISLSENSIFLKPGQEKNIELKIESDANFLSTSYFTVNPINEIEAKITPDVLSIPPNGISTSLVNIEALENATIHPHTLSISSLIYPNETLSIGFNQLEGNLQHAILQSNLDLVAVVEEPLTILDYVDNTLNAWGKPIRDFFTLITTIGGAGISGWILNRVRNKINRKNRNNNINNIKINYDSTNNISRNKGAPF